MHIAFADPLKKGSGAVIFSQRFLPLLESLQSRGAIADSNSLSLDITRFLEDLFGTLGGLQRCLCFPGLKQRNDALAAEGEDLKSGEAAIEERARSELGMIKPGETFYRVVETEPVPPADSDDTNADEDPQ